MRYLVVVLMLFLAACVPTIPQEKWAQADFGEKPEGTKYLEFIEDSIKSRLIDPDSLKLTCAEPRKGSVKDGVGYAPHKFGWVVYCSVNAKNRFGGYVGAKPYVYLFQGNNYITSQTYDPVENFDFNFKP